MDNPPAFPRTGEGFGNPSYDTPGMSLRDYFAAAALPAVIRQCAGDGAFGFPEGVQSIEGLFAQNAYRIADALLAARKGESDHG